MSDGASIELATVKSVNKSNWTVTVHTVLSGKIIEDIQVGSVYCNVKNGGGQGILPEVGADCLVVTPSDGSSPVVLTFLMPFSNDEGYAGGRSKSSTGDVSYGTNSGNKIDITKGDVISLSAGVGLAKRILSGKAGLVQDVSEMYKAETSAGSLQFGPRQTVLDVSGFRKTFFRLDIKKIEKPIPLPDLQIEMGDIQLAPDKILRISLPTRLYEMTVDLLGQREERATRISMEATAIMSLKAPQIFIGGETAYDSAILGSFLTSVFINHTHPISGANTLAPNIYNTPVSIAPYLSLIVRLK